MSEGRRSCGYQTRRVETWAVKGEAEATISVRARIWIRLSPPARANWMFEPFSIFSFFDSLFSFSFLPPFRAIPSLMHARTTLSIRRLYSYEALLTLKRMLSPRQLKIWTPFYSKRGFIFFAFPLPSSFSRSLWAVFLVYWILSRALIIFFNYMPFRFVPWIGTT